MKYTTTAAALFALLGHTTAQLPSNTDLYTLIFGPTATPPPNAHSIELADFTICTNYVLSLPTTHNLPATVISELNSIDASGLCEICTSLSLSRVDSCCGVASSEACFFQGAAATGPANTEATTTGTSGATATGGSSAATSKNGGQQVNAAGPIVMGVLGAVGMIL